MKAPDAFRTISEVAEDLDLPQHVLRFWETRFVQIKPMKRGGGRRYYRPDDIELLRGIRNLLYAEGFTIRGVQRLLKENGVAFVASVGQTGLAQRPGVDAWDKPSDIASPLVYDDAGGSEDDVFAFLPDAIAPGPEHAGSEQSVPDDAMAPGFGSPSDTRRDADTPSSPESARSLRKILADLEEAQRLLEQVR